MDTTPSLRCVTVWYLRVIYASLLVLGGLGSEWTAFAQINPLFEGLPPPVKEDVNTRQIVQRTNHRLKDENLSYADRANIVDKARDEVRASEAKHRAAESKRLFEENLSRIAEKSPEVAEKIRADAQERESPSRVRDPFAATDGEATPEELAAERKQAELLSGVKYGRPTSKAAAPVPGGSGESGPGIDPSQFQEKLEFKPKTAK